jgi:hypothetical protein
MLSGLRTYYGLCRGCPPRSHFLVSRWFDLSFGIAACPTLLFLLVAGLVVVLEQVLAEVASEVAPYRMDVIGAVLCVV